MNEEQTPVDGEEGSEEQAPQNVQLPLETYNALLDRLAALEEAEAQPRKAKDRPSTIDELAEEGRAPASQEPAVRQPPKDLDELTNTQLAMYIVDEINRQASDRLNKVEVSVETLRIWREIDKAEAKHQDFWQYEDKVRELSVANPSLSIEEAYLLAKSKSPVKEKQGDNRQNREPTRTERLLNLPARAFGEKPNVAPSSTSETNAKHTLRSAAQRAWEEQVGKGKTSL